MLNKDKENLDNILLEALTNRIEMKITALNSSFNTKLIGIDLDKYLVLKLNSIDNNLKEKLNNCKSSVEFIYNDSVLGFHSDIIVTTSVPDELIFLDYPKSIKNCERRSEPRSECFLPAQFEIGDIFIEGPIIDISTNGCCCKLINGTKFDKDKLNKMTIYLRRSEDEKAISVTGNVKSIRYVGNEINIGVVFDEINEKTKDLMKNILPNLSTEKNNNS